MDSHLKLSHVHFFVDSHSLNRFLKSPVDVHATQWYGKKFLEEMDDGCSMTMMMKWILSDEVMDNVWQSANMSSYYFFKNG